MRLELGLSEKNAIGTKAERLFFNQKRGIGSELRARQT